VLAGRFRMPVQQVSNVVLAHRLVLAGPDSVEKQGARVTVARVEEVQVLFQMPSGLSMMGSVGVFGLFLSVLPVRFRPRWLRLPVSDRGLLGCVRRHRRAAGSWWCLGARDGFVVLVRESALQRQTCSTRPARARMFGLGGLF